MSIALRPSSVRDPTGAGHGTVFDHLVPHVRHGIDLLVADSCALPLSLAEDVLDAKERSRLRRLHPRARASFRRRLLVRLLVSAHTGSRVDEPFDGVPCARCGVTHSAPRSQTMRYLGLESSASHTGSAVAVAFGSTVLGVDIEAVANVTPAALSLALTAEERESLAGVCAADRPQEAARYWTCKEAASKAAGVGNSVPMRAWRVDPAHGCDRVSVADDMGRRWSGVTVSMPCARVAAVVWPSELSGASETRWATRYISYQDIRVEVTHAAVSFHGAGSK